MSGNKHGAHANYQGACASISIRALTMAAYILFLLPIVIFFCGWLKWYFALAGSAGLIAGFIWLYRTDYLSNRDTLKVPVKHLVGILVVIGLWVGCSGICHFGAEMYDISWRNIFLTDLISEPWPVVYDGGYTLAYYFVFWMVPSLVGKVAGVGAAYVALWLYEVCILSVTVGLFSYLLKANRPSVFWMVTVVFLFFSGLNLVGTVVTNAFGRNLYGLSFFGVEAYCDAFFTGQSTNFYYRGNLDVLSETYNQTLFWLAVPLMLQNRKIHSLAYLGLLIAPFSPWACIGIVPLMLCVGVIEVVRYVRENKPGAGRAVLWTLREVFSPANVLALVIIGVVIGSLFMCGTRLEGASATDAATAFGVQQSGSAGLLDLGLFTKQTWAGYLLFCACEFGVFALFLVRKNLKNALFWTAVIWLFICPFIWVGTISGRDFCMNASLPALCYIMFLIMEKLEADVMGKPLDLRNLAFIVVLTIAFSSPVMQICGQTNLLYQNHALYVPSLHAGMTTFEGQDVSNVSNFVCSDPDDTFFFTVLAR